MSGADNARAGGAQAGSIISIDTGCCGGLVEATQVSIQVPAGSTIQMARESFSIASLWQDRDGGVNNNVGVQVGIAAVRDGLGISNPIGAQCRNDVDNSIHYVAFLEAWLGGGQSLCYNHRDDLFNNQTLGFIVGIAGAGGETIGLHYFPGGPGICFGSSGNATPGNCFAGVVIPAVPCNFNLQGWSCDSITFGERRWLDPPDRVGRWQARFRIGNEATWQYRVAGIYRTVGAPGNAAISQQLLQPGWVRCQQNFPFGLWRFKFREEPNPTC